MLPADKTPARSVAQIRKDNVEKKKEGAKKLPCRMSQTKVAAAKKGQDGIKGPPRSVQKMIKRTPEDEANGSSKARKVSSQAVRTLSLGKDRPTSSEKSLKSFGFWIDLVHKEPSASTALKSGVPLGTATGSATVVSDLSLQPVSQDLSPR